MLPSSFKAQRNSAACWFLWVSSTVCRPRLFWPRFVVCFSFEIPSSSPLPSHTQNLTVTHPTPSPSKTVSHNYPAVPKVCFLFLWEIAVYRWKSIESFRQRGEKATVAAAWIPPHTHTLSIVFSPIIKANSVAFFSLSCVCFVMAVEPTPSGRACLPAGGQMGVIMLFFTSSRSWLPARGN